MSPARQIRCPQPPPHETLWPEPSSPKCPDGFQQPPEPCTGPVGSPSTPVVLAAMQGWRAAGRLEPTTWALPHSPSGWAEGETGRFPQDPSCHCWSLWSDCRSARGMDFIFLVLLLTNGAKRWGASPLPERLWPHLETTGHCTEEQTGVPPPARGNPEPRTSEDGPPAALPFDCRQGLEPQSCPAPPPRCPRLLPVSSTTPPCHFVTADTPQASLACSLVQGPVLLTWVGLCPED